MADYSLADSVNFCLFLELFLFPVATAYYSGNYSRTIGAGLSPGPATAYDHHHHQILN